MKTNGNCYFFGTFNPPHLGHIGLAKKVKEEFNFDKIIFVPAYLPPHKESLDFYHRYNMLKLCVSNSFGEVSDIESRLNPPSYTFQTINYLSKNLSNGKKIPFIIGYDAFINIEKWKNPEILKEKIEFIVLKRRENGKDAKEEAELEAKIMALLDKGFDFKIAKTIDYFDVSSNQIRDLAQNNEDIGKFVDKKVEGYIDAHGLYR